MKKSMKMIKPYEDDYGGYDDTGDDNGVIMKPNQVYILSSFGD